MMKLDLLVRHHELALWTFLPTNREAGQSCPICGLPFKSQPRQPSLSAVALDCLIKKFTGNPGIWSTNCWGVAGNFLNIGHLPACSSFHVDLWAWWLDHPTAFSIQLTTVASPGQSSWPKHVLRRCKDLSGPPLKESRPLRCRGSKGSPVDFRSLGCVYPRNTLWLGRNG